MKIPGQGVSAVRGPPWSESDGCEKLLWHVEGKASLAMKNAHSSRRYPFWMLVCWMFSDMANTKLIGFS